MLVMRAEAKSPKKGLSFLVKFFKKKRHYIYIES